jgi:hypothetical protein
VVDRTERVCRCAFMLFLADVASNTLVVRAPMRPVQNTNHQHLGMQEELVHYWLRSGAAAHVPSPPVKLRIGDRRGWEMLVNCEADLQYCETRNTEHNDIQIVRQIHNLSVYSQIYHNHTHSSQVIHMQGHSCFKIRRCHPSMNKRHEHGQRNTKQPLPVFPISNA